MKAIRNPCKKKMEPKFRNKKNHSMVNILNMLHKMLMGKENLKTHRPQTKNVYKIIDIEPTGKPGTATTNKRPVPTQPDPKKPAPTPVVERKNPSTVVGGGRVSIGADKGNPKGNPTPKTEGRQIII